MRPTCYCRILFILALAVVTPAPCRVWASASCNMRQSLQNAVSVPDVWAHSTTPKLALISDDNHLEQLLVTTAEVVGGMRDAILSAQGEILLQIYAYNGSDEAARAVMDALWRRALRALASDDAPLSIRIIVSRTFWSENVNTQNDLEGLIGYIAAHPRAQGRLRMDLASWRGSPLSILHTKTLICDGHNALVMTGNLNTHGGIDADSFNLAARLTGPVVAILRADWQDARRGAVQDKATQGSWPHALEPLADMLASPSSTPPLAAAVLTRQADWRPRRGSERNPQDQGIISLIDAAHKQICIINPTINIAQVQQALARAIIERGVEVFMVLSYEMNRARERRYFGGDNAQNVHRLYAALLARAGPAAADRLHIAWGASDGVTISPPHDPGNIHAKVMSIDDDALLIGSTNFNWLSWYNARELSVALLGEGAVLAFRHTVFRPLFARAARLRPEDLDAESSVRPSAVETYLRQRMFVVTP